MILCSNVEISNDNVEISNDNVEISNDSITIYFNSELLPKNNYWVNWMKNCEIKEYKGQKYKLYKINPKWSTEATEYNYPPLILILRHYCYINGVSGEVYNYILKNHRAIENQYAPEETQCALEDIWDIKRKSGDRTDYKDVKYKLQITIDNYFSLYQISSDIVDSDIKCIIRQWLQVNITDYTMAINQSVKLYTSEFLCRVLDCKGIICCNNALYVIDLNGEYLQVSNLTVPHDIDVQITIRKRFNTLLEFCTKFSYTFDRNIIFLLQIYNELFYLDIQCYTKWGWYKNSNDNCYDTCYDINGKIIKCKKGDKYIVNPLLGLE